MRSLLETEEEVDERASEITLSTASLLGIFFGLVLICGVFFGFGYSMGRGVGPTAQASALEGNETEVAQKEPALEPAARDSEAPASPAEREPAAAAVEHRSEPARSMIAAPPEDTAKGAPSVTSKPAQPVISKPSAARLVTVPSYTPPADAPPSASGQPMVQIAAVARREDADVLVSALRQRGYGVVVRNEPQDNLLHVQVGPFANRGQAAAMKQKLLSDGYNAIIKQ
jgi:DedD protein